MTDNGGPAFPAIPGGTAVGPCCHWGGMSLLDWFASQALPEVIRETPIVGNREDVIARRAYWYAEAMLKAREAIAKAEGGE